MEDALLERWQEDRGLSSLVSPWRESAHVQFGRIAVHILIKFRASIYIALTFTAPYLTNAFDGTFVGMATVTTKCALSTTRTTTFAVPGHGQVSVEFVFSVSNKK